MQTFSIYTLGCKVNQYETEQLREYLRGLGLRETKPGAARLVIVNTCCVTHNASAKCRQYINKTKRSNPQARILICGCLPRTQNRELGEIDENTHVIKYRHNYTKTLKQIVQRTYKNTSTGDINGNIRTSRGDKIKDKSPKLTGSCEDNLPSLTKFSTRTRAFLKVQDGCDGWCSYCIIPTVRSRMSSKPKEDVLDEAKALTAAGHREIVVTGVFLGAYGKNTVRRKRWDRRVNAELIKLLEDLSQINGLERIRLSSLEPADINPELVKLIKNTGKFAPHLHLSLQSGADRILKRMARQYTSSEFLEKVELLKSELDRPAITTDIIVGFPGESEQDFRASCDVAEKAGFSKIHIFPFSPRTGTAAAKMKNTVNSKTKKERAERLKNLAQELAKSYREQFTGETCNVLVEKTEKQPQGLSERYFPVTINNSNGEISENDIVKVRLKRCSANGLTGVI